MRSRQPETLQLRVDDAWIGLAGVFVVDAQLVDHAVAVVLDEDVVVGQQAQESVVWSWRSSDRSRRWVRPETATAPDPPLEETRA